MITPFRPSLSPLRPVRPFGLLGRTLWLRGHSLRSACCKSQKSGSGSQDHQAQHAPPPPPPSTLSVPFWSSPPTWHRATVNTLRCLAGCSAGDFAAMWLLQSYCPDLGMWPIMGISMASGLLSSITLETVLLRYGRDRLAWPRAARTAVGMSFLSMLTMELAENAVDYHLTSGLVDLSDPAFWTAAAMSMLAGFVAPLPYNYVRLRRYGKACH